MCGKIIADIITLEKLLLYFLKFTINLDICKTKTKFTAAWIGMYKMQRWSIHIILKKMSESEIVALR